MGGMRWGGKLCSRSTTEIVSREGLGEEGSGESKGGMRSHSETPWPANSPTTAPCKICFLSRKSLFPCYARERLTTCETFGAKRPRIKTARRGGDTTDKAAEGGGREGRWAMKWVARPRRRARRQVRVRTIARQIVGEEGEQVEELMHSSQARVAKERREEEMEGMREERRQAARRPLRPGLLLSREEEKWRISGGADWPKMRDMSTARGARSHRKARQEMMERRALLMEEVASSL